MERISSFAIKGISPVITDVFTDFLYKELHENPELSIHFLNKFPELLLNSDSRSEARKIVHTLSEFLFNSRLNG